VTSAEELHREAVTAEAEDLAYEMRQEMRENVEHRLAKLERAVDKMRDAISRQLMELDDLIADVRAEMDP